MRVAALYDIHGNLPALEAVVRDGLEAGVDTFVIGGDVVPGPMATESLTAVSELGLPTHFLRGNGEREVAAVLAGLQTPVPDSVADMLRWVGAELTSAQVEFVREWPETVTLSIEGIGDVLFCHATPDSDSEIFTRVTPEERIRRPFDEVDETVVVCGHTHMQFDRMIGDTRVVNAGSVGMPFGVPGAYWLLLGPDMELRRTEYDLAAAAERIRGTRYPEAEDFARGNVLEPPSEETILAAFEGART